MSKQMPVLVLLRYVRVGRIVVHELFVRPSVFLLIRLLSCVSVM